MTSYVWTFSCRTCGKVHTPLNETPLAVETHTCADVGENCKDTRND